MVALIARRASGAAAGAVAGIGGPLNSCGPEDASALPVGRDTSHCTSSGLASTLTCCSWPMKAARVSGKRAPRTQSLTQTACTAAVHSAMSHCKQVGAQLLYLVQLRVCSCVANLGD